MSRRVLAVAVAVAVILTVVWWLALKSPQSNAIKKAHGQQAASALEVTTLHAQATALLLQKAKLPAEQAQLAALEQALPTQAALASVIDDIHQAATTSGVDLQNLSQSAATSTVGSSATATPTGGLANVTLAVSASGTYPQLVDFVTELNLMARTMVVDNVSLSAGQAGGPIVAQLTGRMFFVPAGS